MYKIIKFPSKLREICEGGKAICRYWNYRGFLEGLYEDVVDSRDRSSFRKEINFTIGGKPHAKGIEKLIRLEIQDRESYESILKEVKSEFPLFVSFGLTDKELNFLYKNSDEAKKFAREVIIEYIKREIVNKLIRNSSSKKLGQFVSNLEKSVEEFEVNLREIADELVEA